MQASDFRGLYAIIPTPAVPGAESFTAHNTVALDETERLVTNLIRDRSSGLIILGTTGECATLTQDEYRGFVDCVARTVNKRIPLFVGATALGAHEVRDRLAFAQEQGADGTLLGLPMWQPCTTEMAVRHYADVAAVFPDLPIMVYANTRAFRFAFPTEFWAAIAAEAPTVIAAKAGVVGKLKDNLAATANRIHFMPNDMFIADFHALAPDATTACWATAAAMGPEPCVAIADAVVAGNITRIREISDRIAWTNAPLEPIFSDLETFASYNIQLEKTRIAEAGYCKPGPIRPPYNVFPEDLAALSRECGRRWRQLRAEFAPQGAAAAQ
jgi:trans-o-hydroxybenzylidenepyruvate hydratase-aldolase